MTLILQRYKDDSLPQPVALNPLHIESATSSNTGTRLTMASGRKYEVIEPFDVYLIRWTMAVEAIQNVAEWDPSEDEIGNEDEAEDLSEDCLS